MPLLPNAHTFAGRHWETGSIANVLAYQGVKAPHSGQPISEALLLGISGGVTVGYFTFHYEGYEPHLALLTRNTFSPMETIFDRLAIARDVLQTDNPHKGESNVVDMLESGCPPMVWADMFSLPYNNLRADERMWGMSPVVVFGDEGESVVIADRSAAPLHVDKAAFMAARSRVKQDKFRVMSLHAPDFGRLASAVQKGIWQCISLYTENPPKGAKDNWGLAALQKWAAMLTNTRNKQSWARFFPRGAGLYSALIGHKGQPGAFEWICTWQAADGAERGLYADFLDEAALILGKPALNDVAQTFRKSADAWCALANALLPDDCAPLKVARELTLSRRRLFIEHGDARLDDIRTIDERLAELRKATALEFPLSERETAALLENIATHVLAIHDIERDAINQLQAAVS